MNDALFVFGFIAALFVVAAIIIASNNDVNETL